jgi:hypothetical protein
MPKGDSPAGIRGSQSPSRTDCQINSTPAQRLSVYPHTASSTIKLLARVQARLEPVPERAALPVREQEPVAQQPED